MTLKILGAGFGRTGTKSTKMALEHLGFGPCHHMSEIGKNPELLRPWQDLVGGKLVNWELVFRGYQAQLDWPGTVFWRELSTAYPNAKVILTTRDPDQWYTSISSTILRSFNEIGVLPPSPRRNLLLMARHLIDDGVFGGKLNDPEHAKRIFVEHIDAVRAEIPKDRLLEFDAREGWQPLCAFFGREVPDIPFPRTNTKTEYREIHVSSA